MDPFSATSISGSSRPAFLVSRTFSWYIAGTQTCTFYMQHGCCKFGPTCMFDHPMGAINFGPSASSLTEMPPVAPYLLGASLSTLPPTSAPASEREPEYGLVPTREPNSSRTTNTSSVTISSTFSQTPPVSHSNVQRLG